MPAAKKTPAKKKTAKPKAKAAALIKPKAQQEPVEAAPVVDAGSLARRKHELLAIVKDPDSTPQRRLAAQEGLTEIQHVPILSYQELQRLG